MKKALINIDYSYDFVANDGKLTCGRPAQVIEDRICELTEEFILNDDDVYVLMDGHDKDDPDHPESKLFPPHNIFGTIGRELYGKMKEVYEKHKARIRWIDKTRYSAFAGTDLAIRLRARGITEVHLVGVCTDICVLHTAVDAYNLGFKIVVHEDAVASFNQAGHEWALSHFKGSLGAQVVKKGV